MPKCYFFSMIFRNAITMLTLRYRGAENRRELTLDARTENVEQVTAFVDEILEGMDCPMKTQMQIDVAIDELFSNIANYAYGEQGGKVTVAVETMEAPRAVAITFIDRGIPYDPLSKADPDTTLSAEERQLGGLGIFLVRRKVDDVRYVYENGKNVLTIEKVI